MVDRIYLGVLVKVECPCSWSSAVQSVASSAVLAIQWKSVVTWLALDWAAIDLDSNTARGRSACSVSAIYSSTSASCS